MQAPLTYLLRNNHATQKNQNRMQGISTSSDNSLCI